MTSQNNGNLGRATITPGTGQTPFVETYTYDQLNRLATATENKSGVQQWKQSFTFDQWGNRSVDTGNTTANTMPPALTYNTATNRITGPGVYGFDNAGNMTQDPLSGTTTYTLNADNRVATAVRNSVTVGTYTYDGEGRRVKRVTSTTTTRYIFDAGGKLVAEYTGSTPTLEREYIASAVVIPASQPAPGGDANNRTQYLTTDHLGSPRMITNAIGAVYSRRDFLPFGELIDPAIGSRSSVTGYSNGSTDGEKHKFTGKERDTETGNDFFEARYYRDILGRFTSPDPLHGAANRPQSWNRYAYVLGNPLKLIDPSGMAESLASASGNRRYVNTFDEDTLGLGNDNFAVVAGYTGGYTYGTIATQVAAFSSETGAHPEPPVQDTIERAATSVGLLKSIFGSITKGATVALKAVGKVFTPIKIAIALAFPSDYGRHHGTVGDLPPADVLDTFVPGSVKIQELRHTEIFFRVFSAPQFMRGSYLTATEYHDSSQAIRELALDPAKTPNQATHIVTVIVPKGTAIWRGIVAPSGNLPGGGSQIYLPGAATNAAIKFVDPRPIQH